MKKDVWHGNERRTCRKQHVRYFFNTKPQLIKSLPKVIVNKTITVALVALLGSGGLMGLYASTVHAAGTAPTVLGELPYQELLSHELTPNANLLVNVADGNVILQSQDFYINGDQIPLSITRYFNDQATNTGEAGSRDTLSIGSDVHITANGNGSATYQGPSGFQVTYPSNGSGGYTTPSTYNGATLASVSGGGWTLTFNQTGEVYTFNSAGNQIKDASANGEAINFAYNSSGQLSTVTDTEGRITTFSYPNSSEMEITDPTGREDLYVFNGSDQLTTFENASSNVYKYAYDSNGNLNSITLPNKSVDTLTYNSSKQVTAITYDSNDEAGASAATWDYTYNSGSTVVTDPLGNTTTYNYDSSGRVTSITDADGNTYSENWNSNNTLASVKDADGNSTNYTYSTLNNLTAITNPSLPDGDTGAQTTFNYGSASHPYSVTQSTDSQGNQTAYSYDTNGNALSTTNTSSGGSGMGQIVVTYQGDPNGSGGTVNCGGQPGEECSSIDANGNTTTYGYDSNGNLTSITPPGSVGAETITYDSLSRPATIENANGVTETITYNNADEPTQIQTSDGKDYTFNYDIQGNLLGSVNNETGVSTFYTYDGDNRMLTAMQTGAAMQPIKISYTYDLDGNLKSESSILDIHGNAPGEPATNAGTTTYTYDGANNVTNISNPTSGYSESIAYTYDRPTSITLPGGITETIGYDQDGRETSIVATKGSTTLTDYTGTYTNSSGSDTNLLQSEVNHVTGVTTTYSYDGLNRLTAATQTGGSTDNSYTYTYDDNGNLTGSTHNGVAGPTYGYNADNELTTVNGSSSGSYDSAGDQTDTTTGLSASYNELGESSSFTPSGGSAVSATYGTANQSGRTSIGTTSESEGTLGLYSDTTNGTDTTTGTNTWYTQLPTGDDQTVGETIGITPYYYLTNLEGSVVGVTDGSGNVQDTYSYDPYGNLISSTGTVSNPYRFDDAYYDTSTGLYWMQNRYYNPTEARWMQLDSTGQNPGYIFTDDNPVNNFDPSGQSFWSFIHKDYGNDCDIAFLLGGAIIGAGLLIAPIPVYAAIAAGVVTGVGGYYLQDAVCHG